MYRISVRKKNEQWYKIHDAETASAARAAVWLAAEQLECDYIGVWYPFTAMWSDRCCLKTWTVNDG